MVFAHDTEAALASVTALVNTAHPDEEGLPDLAALDEFFKTYGWTGKRDRTQGGAAVGAEPASAAAPNLGGGRGRGRGDRQFAAARVASRCRNSCDTTASHTTCTRLRPTRRWPRAWPSRPRWPSSTSSAAAS